MLKKSTVELSFMSRANMCRPSQRSRCKVKCKMQFIEIQQQNKVFIGREEGYIAGQGETVGRWVSKESFVREAKERYLMITR